jgi:hypothetical protein
MIIDSIISEYCFTYVTVFTEFLRNLRGRYTLIIFLFAIKQSSQWLAVIC